MTTEELKIQVQGLVNANWSQEERQEIDLILSSLESNESESQLRGKISTLSDCKMLITLCERF